MSVNDSYQQVRKTCQQATFGLLKHFGAIPNPSKNLTPPILVGLTRTRTRQPAVFAGYAQSQQF